MRRALAATLLLIACRPGAGGGSVSPAAIRDALSGVERTSLEVRPRGPWASHYGASANHPLGPVESVLAARLSAMGLGADAGLSKAVRELASLAPQHANIPSALTDGVLAWAGVVDPAPRLVVVEFAEDPARCLERMSPPCEEAITSLVEGVAETVTRTPNTRFGVGVARAPSGATRMMVGVLERAVELDPVPSRLRTRAATELRVRLQGNRRDPAFEVTLPSGQSRGLVAQRRGDGSVAASFACDAGDGAYQVEVLADGAHGIEVAAIFPLFCGVAAPKSIVAEIERLGPDVSADDVALASFHFLNQMRADRNLPALRWDDRAAAVAEAHSVDMRRSGFVGHVSPTTGDVSARYARAKIAATVVRENVARGYGPAGIHDSLLRSPGHRANMIATDVTHVGIGVVLGAAESDAPGAPRPVFLTQNFHRPPGEGAPKAAAMVPTLRGRIERARAQAGLAPARWDDGLDAVADELAAARARGRAAPAKWEQRVFAEGHAGVEQHLVESADFDALGGVALWTAVDLHVGLGIARSSDGRFVLVALVVP
jgi:uncharacterized protein YkwD